MDEYHESTQETWDKVSEKYDLEITDIEKELAQEIIVLLKKHQIFPGSKLIELGCGSGHLSACLAMEGYKVTLLDFSKIALEKAEATFEKYGLNGTYIEGDLMNLNSLKVGTDYDLVWNSGVMEHFKDDSFVSIVNGFHNLSSKKMLMIVPNYRSIAYLLYRFMMHSEGRWDVGNEYVRRDYVELLQRAQWTVVESQFMATLFTNHFFSSIFYDHRYANIYSEMMNANLLPETDKYLIGFYAETNNEESASFEDNKINKEISTGVYETELGLRGENYGLNKNLADTLNQLKQSESEREDIKQELESNIKNSKQELENIKLEFDHNYTRLKQESYILKHQNELINSQMEAALMQLNRRPVRLSLRTIGLISKLRHVSFSNKIKLCFKLVGRVFGVKYDLGTEEYSPYYLMRQHLLYTAPQYDNQEGIILPSTNENEWDNDIIDVLNISKHNKKRVAYITNQVVDWEDGRPRFGGGERYLLTLARLLERHGFDVHIFQPAFFDSETTYYGFKVTTFSELEMFSEFNLDKDDRLYRLSLEYDHVIYNTPEYASAKVRKDALLVFHGIWFDHNNYTNTRFREPKWFNHLFRLFNNPLKIVSVDTNSINVVRALFPKLAEKMTYIPNFVDMDVFYPPETPRHYEKLIVLFPRRSQVNRGSRILSDILRRVPHDVDFYWVGEGDAEDSQIIIDLSEKDKRLHFVNSATFDEMPEWYRMADIAVIPTIASEGTSLSCLEAMASGCATIATNVGGLTDLVFDNINGLCVNATAEEIADAINRVILDEPLRKRLQTSGREYAYKFSLTNWENKWLDILYSAKWIKKTEQSNLRICIITRNAVHGGVESLIKMEEEFFDADVIVTGGINNPYNSCPFHYKYIENYKSLLFELTKYDVAIYHYPADWAVKAIKSSGIFSIEFVHRTDTSDCDKMVPNVIASHSQYVLDYVRENYENKGNLQYVANGVDLDWFRPVENRSKNIVIGLPTSYGPIKGIDIIIEAWRLLPERFKKQYNLILHGAGTEERMLEYEKQARESGEEIQLLGPITNTKGFYDELLLYVTASRVEGLPISVLEAMSCNIPIIASDIEGHKVINEMAQKEGFDAPLTLFGSEKPQELADAITMFLDNKTFIDTRVVVEKLFSGEAHCGALKSLINKFYYSE